MLITREMDYAVRILRALQSGKLMSAPDISQQEHIQAAVTYKMLKKLVKGGLIESKRGPDGGYQMIRPSSEVTLYDLFAALQVDLMVTECLETDYHCENNLCGTCGVHRELERIQKVMEAEFKSKTLQQLFDEPQPHPKAANS